MEVARHKECTLVLSMGVVVTGARVGRVGRCDSVAIVTSETFAFKKNKMQMDFRSFPFHTMASKICAK